MQRLCALSFIVTIFAFAAAGVQTLHADIRLPAIINSHMVLQRDKPISIWGWAEPGEAVTVCLDDNTSATKADEDGAWHIKLNPLKADGETHRLIVRGNNTIELEDILVGEVWVGSGQSNMAWPMSATHDGKQSIATAKHSAIRLFHIPDVQIKEPNNDVKAEWKPSTPASVQQFSEVLYYFGKKLHEELNVPVGLINSSRNGSFIAQWTITDERSGDLYNEMIAPLQPLAIRGAIWYQGETNVLMKDGFRYYDKMEALIRGWRRTWKQKIPFYYVQIAPWSGDYGVGQLPALWEAQVASLKIPGTGMVVTTDLVEDITSIHSSNKSAVGHRLARWALAKTYRKEGLVYSGPLYKSMQIEGDRIRIWFAHADGGLDSSDGKPLTEFKIASADNRFVKAQADIVGETLVVHADEVAEPVHVSFGWRNNASPNLINKTGLPASPFRTNNWRGGTGD